ncbi:hypothetical protein PYW08_012714 [Mythimna loreyi]|uniref:Uncharacterized protein n=1 Tax=Mythimna loreyi TaxID=667449 RepID=A0ACC2Q608_9NEOP|nr:hypothetical protein PYW08_012714 [Mythimna loreyi]
MWDSEINLHLSFAPVWSQINYNIVFFIGTQDNPTKDPTTTNKESSKKKQKQPTSPNITKENLEMKEEIKKHYTNLQEILMLSNATPFAAATYQGYICSYCDSIYSEAANLKKHTLEDHIQSYENVVPNANKNTIDEFSVRLDITDLRCKLCYTDIDTIENLLKHLEVTHKREIHADIRNQLLPFKFDSETLKCCICSSTFERFRRLLEHMHIHYRNFICDACDKGFLTKASLKIHVAKHTIGVFKCEFCPKTFDTKKKVQRHQSVVHVFKGYRSKCRHCNARFKNHMRRDEHLVAEHGVKLKVVKCQACDKTFPNTPALRIHTRRDHLMERRFKCTVCDKAFFQAVDVKFHMVTHTKTKEFQCTVCQKFYARKETLRQHMNIHNDTRPFKCNQETINEENVEPAVLVIVGPQQKVNDTLQPYVNELEKHRHNVRQVIQFSNATPILRRGGVGYMCSYCSQEFPEPMDLKMHTLETHDSELNPIFGYSKSAQLSEYNVKMDITDLECTLCSTSIDSLEDLLNHLQQDHDKLIYNDIRNRILPFKFESEKLTCCMCPNTFDKFKKLQEHMHSHYRNFVCNVCDAGFVTQGSMTRHRSTHSTGVFPCSYCPKIFDTQLKKRSHERCNHTHTDVLNRCGYCNKGFRDYHCKELHISEVHGVKPILYKCNACDKCYSTKRKLRLHEKRDHLLERRYKCLTCDMRFFSSHDVKKHMIIHTGEKEFQCEICLKAFGRKSTLNSHMRIHNNDRRYKCEYCGMSFVQKCSWKDERPKVATATEIKIGKRKKAEESIQLKKGLKETVSKEKLQIEPEESSRERKKRLLHKHLHNLKIILECTNATMILKHGDEGYVCSYCTEGFEKPMDLKLHTLTEHQDEDNFYGNIKAKDPSVFLVKLDITNLKCDQLKTVVTEETKDIPTENIYEKSLNTEKELQKTPRTELTKHRNAIKEILLHSNATPIRRYGGIGYTCCYCPEQFEIPGDLKKHTLENHKNISQANFMKNMNMSEYVVKLDITALKCKLCDDDMNTLDSLIDHLHNVHDKKIYKDHINHIFPFKFGPQAETVEIKIEVKREEDEKEQITPLKIADISKHTDPTKAGGHGRGTRIIKIEKPTKANVELKFISKLSARHPNTILKGSISENMKNEINLKNILLNSNANPIRCKDGQGYGCSFCPKQFQETTALKKHFLEEHNNDKLIKYMSAKLFEHVIKLDITYLNCALCDKDIKHLDDLIKHLKEEHNKPMYLDAKSHIVPFRFDSPELKCVICSAEFSYFKLLQEHMNSHFGNYICDICGGGFVTYRLLVNHVKRHDNGEYKCDQCDKTFKNQIKVHEHIMRTHLGQSKRNKCNYCEERFVDYWKKMDHMVKEHGMAPVVLRCSACDRTFDNQRSLSRHTKKDHLLERRHKCSECDMRFFEKSGLQKHMAKHTGLRQFRCEVCLKAYARKNTLREHMRIHANDRRFACLRSRTIRESPIIFEEEDKSITLDRKLNYASFVSIRPVGKKTIPWVREQQKKIAQERRLTELDWQFENIKTVLRCSNATPVRCRVGTRFACSYCLDQFQTPKELRNHSLETHNNDRPEFFNARSLSRHIVYLDITDLICILCEEPIDGLDQLMEHLKTEHDELIYRQIKNQIVPFKYEGIDPESILIEIEVDTSSFFNSDDETEVSTLNEVDKHRENIRTILLASNATPIGRYGSLGYNCCYCTEVYSAPRDLKKHTIERHDEGNISSYMNNYTMLNYIVKLDITGLRCEMCMKPFNELQGIIDHLTIAHQKIFHTDIGSHIVPFRFDSEVLQCVDCSFEFKNFKILLEHMNTHYEATWKAKKHIITIKGNKTRRKKKGIIVINPNNLTERQVKLKRKTEVEKHKDNIRTILYHSNATPIGKYAGIGYSCSFCPQQYETATELKTHTISQHSGSTSSFMEAKGMHNYIIKLDITNLKCDICQTSLNTLDELIEHLKSVHQKFFHEGLNNHILPFKFDTDMSKCLICGIEYGNFKVLLEHMNSHYRNYICDVCDAGFVNKKTLLTHSYRHKTGVFNCSYCSKVFNNNIKKRDHEKAVHICMNKRNKCGYCGEKFNDYTKKNIHEVLVHGAKPKVLKCQACDKTYDNQRALTCHTKAYHLMEKHTSK